MKVLLAGLAIAAAAIGGGLGYAGMKTASLPDWYNNEATPAKTSPVTESAPQASGYPDESQASYEDASYENAAYREAGTDASYESREDFGEVIVTPHTQASDVVISESELSQMVTDAIASQAATAPILDAAQDIRTSLEDGRIESGVVMNLSKLPVEALPDEGQQAVEQFTQTFPFIANRDVYLGIEGSPIIVDGGFSLDDTHIKIGQLKLPVSNVASQLGISQSDIEKQLSGVLDQQGLTPEDVQIVDGKLVIRGAAQ
ncbi:MAG: hypothetical protein AAGC93_30700 [Cyanobacteria bacterium P01_F01_bin.53]